MLKTEIAVLLMMPMLRLFQITLCMEATEFIVKIYQGMKKYLTVKDVQQNKAYH